MEAKVALVGVVVGREAGEVTAAGAAGAGEAKGMAGAGKETVAAGAMVAAVCRQPLNEGLHHESTGAVNQQCQCSFSCSGPKPPTRVTAAVPSSPWRWWGPGRWRRRPG